MLGQVYLISLAFLRLSSVVFRRKDMRNQRLPIQLYLKSKSLLLINYGSILKLITQRDKKKSQFVKSYKILRSQKQRKQLILQVPSLTQVQRNLRFFLTLTSPFLPLLKLLQKVLVVPKVPKQFLYIFGIIVILLFNKIFLTILIQNFLNLILFLLLRFIIKTFLYQYTRVSQFKK